MKLFLITVVLACVFISMGNLIGKDTFPVLKGPYLGQKPPGEIPQIFLPGLVSTKTAELNSIFSKDGKSFYFSREINKVYHIMVMREFKGKWTKPERISFSKKNPTLESLDMMLSQDEKHLYFISNRPTPQFKSMSVNIWRSRWTDSEWAEPKVLPYPINTNKNDVYPMFVADGSMYLGSSRNGGLGSKDIYYLKMVNGRYAKPVNLGPNVNSKYSENDPYVSPDESFIIVPSYKRPDSRGKSDLYISFKTTNADWSKGLNLGAPINTEKSEFCPYLSPDGKYFFFTRDADIFWVDAKFIQEYKVKVLKTQCR